MQTISQPIKCNEVTWNLKNGSAFHFTVARLDELHPFISGNKFFKLKYNLQAAITEGKQGIITMGGAYSNHLAAAAYACYEAGLSSAGIVRGEVDDPYNPTLSFCKQYGMKLIPVERSAYHRNSKKVQQIRDEHSSLFFVPEGGGNSEGLQGCKEILSMIEHADRFTHILCAMGTGTTFKGLAASAVPHQKVIGIPVLKIRVAEREQFLENHATIKAVAEKEVLFDYAGNGYAKFNKEQIEFMNTFYLHTSIPTDIVYTGKLMMAATDLAEQQHYGLQHKVLLIHSGGLQGNNSLPSGTLLF